MNPRTTRFLLFLFTHRNSALGIRSQSSCSPGYIKSITRNATKRNFTSPNSATMSSSSENNESTDFSKRAEQKWSRAANSYVRYFEPMTVTAGRFLLSLLKLRFREKPLRVLEAGCGAGGLARELLLDAGSSTSTLSVSELVLTDLSEGMLERAREALSGISYSKERAIRVSLRRADFMGFYPEAFPDGHFDRYFSNLCLHYAEDPDAVITEAARVLESEGIAGFTVWGRKADSPVMTIVPDIMERFQKTTAAKVEQLQQRPKRSSFHMGEDDHALRQRILAGGFSKCTIVHYPAVLESLDPADYAEAILDGAPSTKKELEEDYSPGDQQVIRRMVRERAEELLAGGEPLILDMAMVVAQK